MERRLYFIVGDVLANASTGALVAVACTSTVADAVPMALAIADRHGGRRDHGHAVGRRSDGGLWGF